jgi:predicted RNA binding protein YcfA (HicA-like mRNA interferase family)
MSVQRESRDAVRSLERAGFQVARYKGSHTTLKHADGRVAVVPLLKFSRAKAAQIQKLINGGSVRFMGDAGKEQ